jgi:WD40 repeat protein
VIAVGDGVWRWRPPTAPAPRTLVAPAGLSGGEVSPDGQWLAVARGDGRVTVWDRATGDVVAELPISSAVIKRVAFSPDGARLAVAVAGPEGVVELDVAGWRARAIEPTVASRRVFYLPDGGLIGAPYGPGLDHWDGRGRRRHLDVPQALDVHVAPGGDVVWMLSRDDRLRSWRDGTLADVAPARGAHALGASADGATVALASTDGVRVLRRRGDGAALDERWLDGGAGEVSEVIVARDGAWVAAGTLTGVVEVWRVADGALVARLRGHRGRNGALALGPRGALITTGWDGAAVAWDLDVLARPAAALAASAAAAWGEGLVVDDVR